ncbi:hypothetical protein D3C76_1853820 [compost metagenome]
MAVADYGVGHGAHGALVSLDHLAIGALLPGQQPGQQFSVGRLAHQRLRRITLPIE